MLHHTSPLEKKCLIQGTLALQVVPSCSLPLFHLFSLEERNLHVCSHVNKVSTSTTLVIGKLMDPVQKWLRTQRLDVETKSGRGRYLVTTKPIQPGLPVIKGHIIRGRSLVAFRSYIIV